MFTFFHVYYICEHDVYMFKGLVTLGPCCLHLHVFMCTFVTIHTFHDARAQCDVLAAAGETPMTMYD